MALARFTAQAKGPLGRLDGRIKTMVLLSAVIVAAVLDRWYLSLGLWAAASSLFWVMPCDRKALLKRLIMPFGIAWLVFLSLLFTHGAQPLFVVPFHFFSLTAYRDGLFFGVIIFLRIMAAVTLVAALSFSTPMIEILETLRLCKVPATLIDIADMMYRYVFIMQDTAHTMRQAQVSRLGETAPCLRRIKDIGAIAGSILIRSLDKSSRIYQAMLSRGYDEDNHELAFFTDAIAVRDKIVGVAAGVALLLLVVANFIRP
ncbi:cobalt ECF transporter T component CbiQ [Martelella alba]|uniref:Cobalt ECF transporter T component CbiQ n=1 Tax=Martelella alba TaxID=2590451 RepID=A0ABY2SL20_9HYPH|nr:cobalt ECF transporter T component CbiQ [Martelella alba]TKI06337.1 cobalt ECF transporter T component CbiQ [Martelella alba]